MQRTSNYQLPQWEKTDRIMMEDFNTAMANIESAIDGAKGDAASANAAAESARSEAQTAAEKAQAAAQTADAITAKAFSPDNMPYKLGTYTGTGLTLTVEVGFRPKAVVTAGRPYSLSEPCSFYSVTFFAALTSSSDTNIKFLDNGFQLSGGSKSVTYNNSSDNYLYIAFR